MPRAAAQASSGARSRVAWRCGSARARGRSTAPSGQRHAVVERGARKATIAVVLAAELVGLGVGDHAAAGEHDDAVGELLRLVHVVGGEEDRLAELAQAGDQLPRLAAGGGVEARRGLVEEDQLGVAGDAEREVEPAALAAAEVLGAGVLTPGQADQVEHLLRVARVRVGGGVDLDRLLDRDRLVEARSPATRCRSGSGRRARAWQGRTRARRRCRRRPCDGLRGSRRGSSCRRRWARAGRAPRRGSRSGPHRRAPCSRRRPCAGPGPGRRLWSPMSCQQDRFLAPRSSSARGSNLRLHPWVETVPPTRPCVDAR